MQNSYFNFCPTYLPAIKRGEQEEEEPGGARESWRRTFPFGASAEPEKVLHAGTNFHFSNFSFNDTEQKISTFFLEGPQIKQNGVTMIC